MLLLKNISWLHWEWLILHQHASCLFELHNQQFKDRHQIKWQLEVKMVLYPDYHSEGVTNNHKHVNPFDSGKFFTSLA